ISGYLNKKDFFANLPIAASFLVCFETLILNILSLNRSVTSVNLIIIHIVFIVVSLFLLRKYIINRILHARPNLKYLSGFYVIAPLILIVIYSAWNYIPNGGDSMTYHMARVAMWVQNCSIEFYPLPVFGHKGYWASYLLQNLGTPGAEYCILVLQVISKSDIWANFIQFFAYAAIILNSPKLLRLAGVPLKLCGLGAIFVATIPMAVLQASSTQNDVVASLMTISLVWASLPFLHKNKTPLPADYFILSCALAACVLVKVTSVFAGLPILIIVGVCCLRQVFKKRKMVGKYISGLSSAVLVLLVLTIPHYYHSYRLLGSFENGVTFPLLGEWREKLFNIFGAFWYHPLSRDYDLNYWHKFRHFLDLPGKTFLDCQYFFAAHEDIIGNPLHVLFLIIICLFLILGITRIKYSRKGFIFGILPILGWISFHFFVRDQPNISRLQTPVFVLFPLLMAVFFTKQKATQPISSLLNLFLKGYVIICLSVAYVVAVTNEARPVRLGQNIQRENTFYQYRPALEGIHSKAIEVAQMMNCHKLGITMFSDNWDYPLIWRAYQQGIRSYYIGDKRFDPTKVGLFFESTDYNQPRTTYNDAIMFTTQFTNVYINRLFYEQIDCENMSIAELLHPHKVEFQKDMLPGDVFEIVFKTIKPLKANYNLEITIDDKCYNVLMKQGEFRDDQYASALFVESKFNHLTICMPRAEKESICQITHVGVTHYVKSQDTNDAAYADNHSNLNGLNSYFDKKD
ncbi:MAG: glycosyltransferase family 39 protein, partial [Kiritimatiellae bacterium]|nr:glycosyltransferase family 39 protein [Kiritimatiellia bacterium]